MRKLIALLLCACLLVPFGIVASAQDMVLLTTTAAPADEVMLINSLELKTGWSGNGSWRLDDFLNEGDSCLSVTYTGSVAALGAMTVIFNANATDTKSYDISYMDYLEFDFYVSEAAKIQNVVFTIELTSSGAFDQQENAAPGTFSKFIGKPLEDGWNHIKVNIGDLVYPCNGGLNPEKWNYMRIFNSDAIDAGEGLVLAIDNLAFSGKAKSENDKTAEALDAIEMKSTANSVALFGCNRAFGTFTLDTEEKVAGSASVSLLVGGRIANGVVFTPVDATGMDTLEFDLYISNEAFYNGLKFGESALELSSGGGPDVSEVCWNMDAVVKSVSDWQIGWNHVALSLADAKKTNINGSAPFDISKVNFLRIYWMEGQATRNDLVVKFDNFRLTKGDSEKEDAEAAVVQELIAQAKALKEKKDAITAANYEEFKAQLSAAKALYATLSTQGKANADSSAVSTLLTSAENALSAYEKSLAEPDQPSDPTPADPTPSDPTPADPADPADPAPVDPADPAPATDSTMSMIIIIVAVTVVIVAAIAVACVVILKKKK